MAAGTRYANAIVTPELVRPRLYPDSWHSTNDSASPGQSGKWRYTMAALTDQFKTALSNIEPCGDDKANAPDAHKDLRAVLLADEVLAGWGIDPVLIGSYARNVSIRRVKDVDVFCRLISLPTGTSRDSILDRFFDVLNDAYGNDDDGNPRVQRQERSITVLFPQYDGLYVDAAPARPTSDGMWEIPERGDDGKWHKTNPVALGDLTSKMNDTHHEKYVPTVKLIRQTRRALLGKRPGGLWFEMAVYEACVQGAVPADGNYATQYTTALEKIADLLDDKVDDGIDLPNPAVDGEVITVRATDTQWDNARTKFRDAATAARAALDSDNRCWAAREFQNLLGGNDDFDAVFPMPADCNPDGTNRSPSLVAGDRNVPAGDSRFG